MSAEERELRRRLRRALRDGATIEEKFQGFTLHWSLERPGPWVRVSLGFLVDHLILRAPLGSVLTIPTW